MDLFKKVAWSLLGFAFIVMAISVVLIFIPFVGILSSFIQSALLAGIYIFLRQLKSGKQNFNQLFEGFNSFGPIALYLIVLFLMFIPLVIIMFTVTFPFGIFMDYVSGGMDPQYMAEEIARSFEGNIGLIMIGYLIIIAGGIYISISYQFVLPLIVDAKLGFWEAMETSRRVIGKKFFMFLLLFLVIGVLGAIGILITCFLGILVVIPYMHCVIFAAYDDILKPSPQASAQISDFGVQERDINTEAEDENK